MFTLTKKKHTLHPKNEQGKQESGAVSEVENYSSHAEPAQKARPAGDWKMWPQTPGSDKHTKKQLLIFED